jgi:high-affinity Fe2+/Pb2+ permease
MNDTTLNFIIGIISIILIFVASFFAYKVYKFNKQAKSWLAIYLGFVTQALYGTLTYFKSNSYLSSITSETMNSILGILLLIASAFFAWGFWNMNKSFESFSVIQSKTKEKIEQFVSKNKKDSKKK